MGWFEKKCRASDHFIVIWSLAWFEDADGEPEPVSLREFSWQEVKERVRGSVSRLR